MRLLKLLTGLFLAAFVFSLLDWMRFGLLAPHVRTGIVVGSLPLSVIWLLWAWRQPKKQRRAAFCVVGTGVFFVGWATAAYLTTWFEWRSEYATVMDVGSVVGFMAGLCWVIYGLERAAQYYRRRLLEQGWQPYDSMHATDSVRHDRQRPRTWNPLDLEAWYYGYGNRRLNQSLAGFLSYSLLIWLLLLLLSLLRGGEETYESPAGGGKQETLTQVVRVQKVVRKKFVVNKFSAIRFDVPPIDEVKLQLSEVTKHVYAVGYGEGTGGAGFGSGVKGGKIRFIRLEYAGGDWDQEFGVGGDLNMLMEYGLRTKQPVAERTESRAISQLKNFPVGKSPPFVFLTGQRSISVTNAEVKTLREYLNEKHGMIFCDNGGSAHFHNQFLSLMQQVEPSLRPVPIPLDDIVHRVPYQIPFFPYVAPHGGKEALGWWKNGRWIAYYHPGDIADAWADGNAGVSRDIWEACYQLGTNVIFYAHVEQEKWKQTQKRAGK